MAEKTTKIAERSWYELQIDGHEHRGKTCAKGDKIQLRPEQADRLGTEVVKPTEAPKDQANG